MALKIDGIYDDLITSIVDSGLVESSASIYFAPSDGDLVNVQDDQLPMVWVLSSDIIDVYNNLDLTIKQIPLKIQVSYRYDDDVSIETITAQKVDNDYQDKLSKIVWLIQQKQITGETSDLTYLTGDVISRVDKSRHATVVTASIEFNLNFEVNYNE